MEPKKRSKVSSDREKWGEVLGKLVKLLKNQQEQLETLAGERKILEDRIDVQHERWVSEIRLYEDHIPQMKEDLLGKEKECYLESATSDFIAGLKQKVASLNKLKLEQTKDELADFKAWFDYLSDSLKKNSKESDTEKEKRLEDEVKRLKHECEKLASEKSSKISARERESAFVRNHYNVLQSNLTKKLESKQSEVEQSNEKIAEILAKEQILQSYNNENDAIIERLATKVAVLQSNLTKKLESKQSEVEQSNDKIAEILAKEQVLQSYNNENDAIIERLATMVAEMEADSNKWKAENSKLSQELELLRKCKTSQLTPVLRHCNAGTRTSTPRVRSSSRDRSNVVVKKELPDRQAHSKNAGKENTGNSKRRRG